MHLRPFSRRLLTRALPALLLVGLMGACNLYDRTIGSMRRAAQARRVRPVHGAENDLPPLQAYQRVDADLGSRGFTRRGEPVHNPSIAQNGLVAYPLDAAAGQCFTLAAFASPGSDLNLVVVGPAGAAVGHNVLPDAHPWVDFCAPAAGRYLARLQMVGGTSETYYAAYERPAGQRGEIARIYGEASASPVQVATIDADTQRRVDSVHATLTGERYTRVTEPRGVQLGARQARDFPLTLQGGQCYAFGSFGGPGTRDTDVFVMDGSGNELAVDQRSDRDGLVRFCPPNAGAYTLRARLYDGTGPVFVAAWARPDASSGVAATTPTPTVEVVGESQDAGGLEENFALLDADMSARGYERYGEPAEAELTQGQSQDFGISLEGGKCYAIFAVGDNGVRDLDLAVLDAGGQELDRDVEADAHPIVRVCPTRSGESRIQVRMASGGGSFRYAAYRWPRGTQGPFGLNGLIYVRLAEVTALLQVDGYQPSADFMPDRGTLRQGAHGRHSLYLPANRCVALVVVGGQGVHDLGASVSLGANTLARDATRNAFPDLRFCTQQQGEYSIDIEAQAGAGDYFYQVFERVE